MTAKAVKILRKENIMTNKAKGYLLLITGFIACPCHLIITAPIILAIVGGTALGAFFTRNALFIIGLLFVYFIFALIFGFKYLESDKRRS